MLNRKKVSGIAMGLMLLQNAYASDYVRLEEVPCYFGSELASESREIQKLNGEELIHCLASFSSGIRGEYTPLSSKDKKKLLKNLQTGQNESLILLNKAAIEGNKEAKQSIIQLIWDNASTFRNVNWFQGAVKVMDTLKVQPKDWQETIKKMGLNFEVDKETVINSFDPKRECSSYTLIHKLILDHPELLYDMCVDYLYRKSQAPKQPRFKLPFFKTSSSAQPKFNRKETQFYKFSQSVNSVIGIEDGWLLSTLVNAKFDSSTYSNRYCQSQGQVKSFLKALPYIKD